MRRFNFVGKDARIYAADVGKLLLLGLLEIEGDELGKNHKA